MRWAAGIFAIVLIVAAGLLTFDAGWVREHFDRVVRLNALPEANKVPLLASSEDLDEALNTTIRSILEEFKRVKIKNQKAQEQHPELDVTSLRLLPSKPQILVATMAAVDPDVFVYEKLKFFHTHQALLYANRHEYAARHGYAVDISRRFENELGENPPGTWALWNKIFYLRRRLPEFDWILMMDEDALFIDMTVSLESIIEKHGKHSPNGELLTHVLFTYDVGGTRKADVNSGVFLIKNSQWSQKFLQEVLDLQSSVSRDDAWGEQRAIIAWIAQHPDDEHVTVVEQRVMNSFHKGGPRTEFQPGDFVIHFAGSRASEEDIAYFLSLVRR